MNLNGIGGGHSTDAHQVTSCMHSHAHYDKTGSMGAAGAAPGAPGRTGSTAENQADAQFSLSAWLEKTFKRGRKLLGGIWGNDAGMSGQPGGRSGAGQAPALINDTSVADGTGLHPAGLRADDPRNVTGNLHTPQIAAAATAVLQPQDLQNNPYFSAVERLDEQQGNLWRRVKVKFKNVAGQLMGHLPGRFLDARAKNSFQAKQERPRKDLRRYSRFRGDEVEIDCVLTDDSYLLDSYDRKGEYSKLSTKK